MKGRISKLEGLLGPATPTKPSPEKEAIIAELRQVEQGEGPVWEKARREAREGRPQRLYALEDLRGRMRERREA